MTDAFGRLVPETPENLARKEKDLAAIAKQEARDKAAAEKAEKKRLAACERRGIAAENAPGPRSRARWSPWAPRTLGPDDVVLERGFHHLPRPFKAGRMIRLSPA